ncbi:hypothetical protein [Mycolicibacterium wolinskyi]|uniref:channel accessory protein ArfC, sunset domain variant n=1 Tax=Mycolicibacterium wolinskyi TaxID=59750 RepID=UPI00391780D4
MNNVNWWLMALSFVLGLVLTLALTVRRVKREVPVYGALGRRPETGGGAATLAGADDATTRLPKVDDATAKLPKVGTPGAAAAGVAAAGGAAGVGAAKLSGRGTDDEPYGAGSIRTAAATTAPAGYTIKGNENSMLYHSPESPSYEQTVAEIWFRDADTAERAGFARWDSARGGAGVAGAAGAAGAAGVAKLASTGETGQAEQPTVVEEAPYGANSVRVSGRGTPAGYTIKGNEDSMLYHSPESPSYKQTIAEIWFRDEESAQEAGFARWDSGKSQRGR